MIKSCLQCGKEFHTYPSRIKLGRGKYCSKKCSNMPTNQTEVVCLYCNKKFMAKDSELSRGGGIYCSKKCASSDYKNHYSGEKASNWKGGKQRSRHNGDYKYSDWRLNIYERDSFTCQECGQVGGKLNAHHRFKWSEFPSFRYEIWNGITLCTKCHKKEHSKKEKTYGSTKR